MEIFTADNIEDIDNNLVAEAVRLDGFALIFMRNCDQLLDTAVLEFLTALQRMGRPAPATEAFTGFVGKKSFWKSAVRSVNGVDSAIAQVMIYMYLNKHDDSIPTLLQLGKLTVKLRNHLLRFDEEFGEDWSTGWWNATRVHHFPAGGGFMAEHVDAYFPAALNGHDLPFLQVACLLSRRGKDFLTGGGFVTSHSGEKFFLEGSVKHPATFAVWDGSCSHGVADVDLHEIMDVTSASGRLSLLAPLQPWRS